jgi:hypothetical protein
MCMKACRHYFVMATLWGVRELCNLLWICETRVDLSVSIGRQRSNDCSLGKVKLLRLHSKSLQIEGCYNPPGGSTKQIQINIQKGS